MDKVLAGEGRYDSVGLRWWHSAGVEQQGIAKKGRAPIRHCSSRRVCSLLENDTAQNFSDFESIREKLKRVRENVSKFSSQTERTRADCRDAIHAEKAKLEPENRRIRGKATTSVNQKLSDCIKKENTLRREHGQILDRVESIKKLIFGPRDVKLM